MSSLAPLPTAELAVLGVPAHWQRIDFLSDLHLEAGMPRTFGAWRDHLLHTPAQAVFLLGDIFEVWVGDDATDDFSRRCAEVLREASATRAVYFMPGNRDFLMGPAWLEPWAWNACLTPACWPLRTVRAVCSATVTHFASMIPITCAFARKYAPPIGSRPFWPSLALRVKRLRSNYAARAGRIKRRRCRRRRSMPTPHGNG